MCRGYWSSGEEGWKQAQTKVQGSKTTTHKASDSMTACLPARLPRTSGFGWKSSGWLGGWMRGWVSRRDWGWPHPGHMTADSLAS